MRALFRCSKIDVYDPASVAGQMHTLLRFVVLRRTTGSLVLTGTDLEWPAVLRGGAQPTARLGDLRAKHVGIDVNKRLIMVAPSPCDKEFAHNGSVTVFCTRQAYCTRDVPTSNLIYV